MKLVKFYLIKMLYQIKYFYLNGEEDKINLILYSMKFRLLTLAFILIAQISLAQDWIVNTEGDTIKCKITLINDKNIFYENTKKMKWYSDNYDNFISLKYVNSYHSKEIAE